MRTTRREAVAALLAVESGRAGELSEDQKRVLDEFKARCTKTTLRSLLRYVYSKYPETTTKSKIREQILPRGKT